MITEEFPPTILDKWRRKAFALTSQLETIDREHHRELKQHKKEMEKIVFDINETERIQAATQGENKAIQDKIEVVNASIKMIEKHIEEFENDSTTSKVVEQYTQVLDIAKSHMNYQYLDVDSLKNKLGEQMNKVSQLTKKLQEIKLPKIPKENKKEKILIERLREELVKKDKEKADQEEEISIYEELGRVMKKYNIYKTQWDGIKNEYEKEKKTREEEEQLRNKLLEIKGETKTKSEETEIKLKSQFDSKKAERDELLRVENKLMKELEEYKDNSVSLENQNKASIEKLTGIVSEQEKQILELEENISRLELQIHEKEKARIELENKVKQQEKKANATPIVNHSNDDDAMAKIEELLAHVLRLAEEDV